MKRKLSALILGAAALAVGFGSLAVAGVVAHKDAIVQTKAAETPQTINFGNADGSVNINAASVTHVDGLRTSWSAVTKGTASFTPQKQYNQIGSSKDPATSFTLTGTLAKAGVIKSVSVKFGGFSGTAGNINVGVGSTSSYATGSLNASSDVTVEETLDVTVAANDKIVVSVTKISKGIKIYSLTYTYDDGAGASYDVAVASNSGTTEVGTGGTLALTALTDGDSSDTYTWSSSDTSVATVSSDGVVTGVTAGTVTITAASKTHPGKSGSIDITVFEAKTYQLVTSVDDLYVGQEVVIGAIHESAGYALGSTQNSNNRAAVEVSISGGILTATPDVESFILGIEDLSSDTSKTVYSFYDSSANGYIFAASSSKNYLRTETNKSHNSLWTIEIDSAGGEATITAQGKNTRNTLMGNFDDDTNLLFSAYASTSNMTTPMLYVSRDAVTAEQKAETFVARYMHLNGYNESTNACAGDDGYYLTAKAALIAMGADVISTLQSSSNPTISAGYARYQAWALACHDSTPFAGEGIVKAQNSLFDFDTKESTNAVLISTLGAAAVVAAAGFIFLKKKKA